MNGPARGKDTDRSGLLAESNTPIGIQGANEVSDKPMTATTTKDASRIYPAWKLVRCPTCDAGPYSPCGKPKLGASAIWVTTSPHAARKKLASEEPHAQ